MHRTLVEFIKVLRNADIQVSPAETLDAMRVLDVIGARDRSLLKHSLSITVSKTLEEKEAFNECFDRFFSSSNYHKEKKQIVSLDDSEQISGNDFQPKQKPKDTQEAKERLIGQTERWEGEEVTNKPQEAESNLGKLLLIGDQTDIMLSIVEAGRRMNLNQIKFFTQKGVYTRKIMDSMGLDDLQREILTLNSDGRPPEQELARRLDNARNQLREKIRGYVENQFLLHADTSGKRLREELLKQIK